MTISRIDTPLKLTATYALFGAAWILVSDGLVAWGAGVGPGERLIDSGKGLLFIGVTSVLLHYLTQRLMARQQAAEVELRTSQARWNFALRSAGTGLWEWNDETQTAYYSPEWKALLGYADHELPNAPAEWLGRIHPDDRARVDQLIQRHIREESGPYESEYRMRTKQGTYVWILARGLVVSRDARGRAREVFGTHTDITARKTAEAQTADALALAKAVLHSSPVGIIAYGPDGRAVIANESAARMIGTDVPGLLQQNFRRLESWQRSGLRAAAEQALATGKEQAHSCHLTTSFGRSLQIQGHLVPFAYDGQAHLLVLISDETVKRRAMDDLHLLHSAVHASPSAWVITDATGLIEWVNPAFTRLTGYAAAEAVGQSTRLLRSGQHALDFYRQLWETIQRGEVWAGEVCNRRKDGTLYDEHMTVAPVRDAGGEIRHFVAIKEDVTERKRLELQVTRTQRLESIGMLASGIAHDLNNVLTPILLSIELLKEKYPDPGARKYIETVETAAQRGAGIVRQVLTFARGMDGGERTEVVPRYLLKDVVQLIEETFPRNIRINYDVPAEVRAVMGDLTQLHQVILNLAVNARDAMPQGGRLTLAARNTTLLSPDPARPGLQPGEHVVLTVADTGTGITPEVLEHMFEPFYTTKPRGKGTGLGLSTVYGIVRSHGGVIEVKSRLGQGTAFEILLPAIPVPVTGDGPSQTPVVLLGRGRRVLVVDDEEPIRRVTTRVLERHGFVPVTAVDGVAGLEAFRADPAGFTVALIDMMMPRMNGAELTRAIRALTPGQPIIISTGLMGSDAESGLDADFGGSVHSFLRKPYLEEELLQVLTLELETAELKLVAGT